MGILDGASLPFIPVERPKSKKSDPKLKRLAKKIEDELGYLQFDAFLIAPVKEGLITYAELINGGLTLFDIEKMHNAIDFYQGIARIAREFSAAENNLGKSKNFRKNGGKIR